MQIKELDTPFVLIDLERMGANIRDMQQIADLGRVRLRPHAKTHKMTEVATLQIEAGAVGVTVAKLGEAEVMADGGVRDILIAYPIIGRRKIERLAALLPRAAITLAVESEEGIAAAAEAGRLAGCRVAVLIEVDSGFRRVGVKPEAEFLRALAARITEESSLELKGLLTFAGQSYDTESDEERRRIATIEAGTVERLAAMLEADGYRMEIVSAGSTPSSRFVAGLPGVTELRPGTYVFGDLMQVKLGAHELDRCALTVYTTIISRPAPDRAVVDAGTKLFSSDGEDSPIGTGRGYAIGHPDVTLEWMTEEHGMLRLDEAARGLRIGDRLAFIPVHCCGVINMTDRVAAVRGSEVEAIWNVAARGKFQ
ncbi:alanine racemase [Paenibacillus qinlingensis]|uniref:D-serine deaminase-like pyridoxal phosphate-dependent protein n=1 Tax=Paenibacillus qinlingensis TaxID=1837343 RepID=A0ABU1NSK2_9BACL|nr:alanine racemase [Paenibacillus qinlingensis]MDR6550424.1 D-serine deaminase-like pyridoxal phosphate-dependent protein [Paenibacillus qinlingensis]